MTNLITRQEGNQQSLTEASTTSGAPICLEQQFSSHILIIDKDLNVHVKIVLALSKLNIQHKRLSFLHAMSEHDARHILAQKQNISLIFLCPDISRTGSGIELLQHIRETNTLTDTRVILRTKQNDSLPEIEELLSFDISDYITKSDLTRAKLYAAVNTAVRSYEQIQAIRASQHSLDLIINANAQLMKLHDLHDFSNGVITQIAKLHNLSPEGMLCAQENSDATYHAPYVIAAAGRYTSFLNQPITKIAQTRISKIVQRSIAEKCNIYEDNFAALYFPGKTSNEFSAFFETLAPLEEIDKKLLEIFCSNVSIGLDNVMLASRLYDFSFSDPLTKLPNRPKFIEITNSTLQTMPSDQNMTLALVDIDHFAETNNTFGNSCCDLLLLAIGNRLQSTLGKQTIIARINSDTFGIIGDSDQVNPTALQNIFHAPFHIKGIDLQLSTTLGLINLNNEYKNKAMKALKNAETALKHAKTHQRSGYLYYSSNMGIEICERVGLTYGLRVAFEDKQLHLVYQPQVDLITKQPIGAEALLRWKIDNDNYISPEDFIPVAEYSGLIIELGRWVLKSACEELVRLRKEGFTDFVMSINVSQAQFQHPRFCEMLRLVLEETGAPPAFIELEITESMVMQDTNFLISLLREIKQLGISIAIDDFGTGFSSLNNLYQLHVDRIKIDRSFTSRITNSTRGNNIAEMIIQLGHNLGLPVIAEGVEDEEQVAALIQMGCPFAQGFMFARPMQSENLLIWLKNYKAH